MRKILATNVPLVDGSCLQACSALKCSLPPTVPRQLKPVSAPSTGWWPLAVVLIPGVLMYFFAFPGLSFEQGRVLGIFVATIIALVAQPVRMGVSVVIAMTILAVTRSLPPAKILSGF